MLVSLCVSLFGNNASAESDACLRFHPHFVFFWNPRLTRHSLPIENGAEALARVTRQVSGRESTHGLKVLEQVPAKVGTSPWPRHFFCSRDCCLCTKHQSVKELRHAGSKGKTSTEKTTQKQKQNTNPKTTKTKPTATTRHPFAAGETGETGETGTMLIKKLVQLCYERQAFFTREDVFTLPCREHSRVKAGSGKRPSKPNHKTTQKPKTTPKTDPHKKKHNKANQSPRTSLSPW